MIRVLVDVAVEEASLARLRGLGELDIVTIPAEEKLRPLPPELIRDVEILFCTYPPENFSDMQRLRWIQIASAGYNHLLSLDLAGRGIRVTNARGCFDLPIAEWNIAMMVNLARNLRQMIRNQDAAAWVVTAEYQQEIRGQTVGLWGYGGIGRETARLARALGMTVHALSREGVTPIGNIYCEPGTGDPEGVLPHRVFLRGQEKEFLSGLDFLVLAMPLTRSTRGIVGEAELRALPRAAFVLNPARGPLIQEQALLRALGEGWIAGAALDTHYKYPLPPEHPLWRFPNVILTPHISGSALNSSFPRRIWEIFSENVARYLAGRPLMNELSREQLLGA